MNNEQDLKLTDLDYLIGSHHLQMMKAALPYMEIPEQRMMSVFVKFNELQRTISLFEQEEVAALGICSLDEKKSPLDMLHAIKPYGNTNEQDFIEMLCNFLLGNRMYHPLQTDSESFEGFGEKLNAASTDDTGNPTGNFSSFGGNSKRWPLDQLKGFLSPEQQSRLETMQMVMQAMQQFT